MLYKILVVDDEITVRNLFADFLKREDCLPVTCASGEEGLEILKKEAFDVVLLDIKLKGMNGLETLQEIRKTHPGLPVVMITGFGFDEELIYKSKQLGCCGYIGKNIPMAKIISTFKQFVKEAKTRDAQ